MKTIGNRVSAIALGMLFFMATAVTAQAQMSLGREFQELSPPRPTSSPNQVEVIEFFYYGCPVCYESQPHIARWLMKVGPGVSLQRVPAAFTESSESFARTFYTLAAMNQIGRLHWPLYDNHHFDGKQLNEEKNVAEWVAGNGIDKQRFSELWNSPEIKERVESAKKALDTYGVKGVPTFVIDGKYITSARMAGSVRNMMQVVESLVERAATERKKQQ
jgi:thiol:disulfide interchange protein DsbA